MSKKRGKKEKKRQKDQEAPPAAAAPRDEAADVSEERLSRRGIKVIAGGVGLLAVGFYILTLTDPHGRNWASTLSPILILGAYAVIALGIFVADPAPAD